MEKLLLELVQKRIAALESKIDKLELDYELKKSVVDHIWYDDKDDEKERKLLFDHVDAERFEAEMALYRARKKLDRWFEIENRLIKLFAKES